MDEDWRSAPIRSSNVDKKAAFGFGFGGDGMDDEPSVFPLRCSNVGFQFSLPRPLIRTETTPSLVGGPRPPPRVPTVGVPLVCLRGARIGCVRFYAKTLTGAVGSYSNLLT